MEEALPGGEVRRAVITHESTRARALHTGAPVIVLVKASEVVLAVVT